jgi:drug/metabolite transporter (DMT)-like permease
VTVLLGLAAAILYGVGDFAGGMGARRTTAVTTLLWSYPVGAVLMAAMLPAFSGHFTLRAGLFGVFGGCCGLVGVIVLYSLMTMAPINIVSPVSAISAAVVPVVVGVAIGERPAATAWAGIVLGLIAVVLVSRTTEDHPHGRVAPALILLAVLSGVGFGLYFVFLDRAGDGTGLWPLLVSRVASAVLIVPIAASRSAIRTVAGRTLAIVLLAGTCDAMANFCFLLAARSGLLSLASVLTSLYPATTVLLAMGLLHEHASRVQRVGLVLAAGAIALITV